MDWSKSGRPSLNVFTDGPPRPSVDSQARSFNDPEDYDIDFDFDDFVAPQTQEFGLPSSTNGATANAMDIVMSRQPLQMTVLQYGKQNPQVAVSEPTPMPRSCRSNTILFCECSSTPLVGWDDGSVFLTHVHLSSRQWRWVWMFRHLMLRQMRWATC